MENRAHAKGDCGRGIKSHNQKRVLGCVRISVCRTGGIYPGYWHDDGRRRKHGNVRPAGPFLVTFYDKDAANTSSIQRFFLGARDGRRNACSGLWAQKLAGKASASVRRVGAKNASCSVFIEKNDQRPDAFSRKERIAATDAVRMLLAKRKKARVEERKAPSVGRRSNRWALSGQLRF